MPDTNTKSSLNADYIDSIDYKKLCPKLKTLLEMMDDSHTENRVARELRYVEIDIEAERGRGKLLPDELLVPQHIIDTNIRREQAAYVQYDTQSPRAVILQDIDNPALDTTVLEKDVTNKLRYDSWQLSKFANIDGMQQNGYGIMELVMDQTKSGELAHEYVKKGDFGIARDTQDIQEAEMTCRNYYFSRTRLYEMASDKQWKFNRAQIDKVIDQQPVDDNNTDASVKERSLYKLQKLMFRVKGIVHVAWACEKFCDDWIRAPRPLYLGRRKPIENPSILDKIKSTMTGVPATQEAFETNYPYFMFPYLISENNVITQHKGRVFLDQDCQQAVMSIVSSYVTGLRRASGAYFSKETEDPNDDLLMQKNIYFRSGALINSKIKAFQMSHPPSECLGAINLLVSSNQQETGQVNFAVNNRKDSRKTAEEIKTATQQAAQLSTVQVVLYSNSSRALYSVMFAIIQSRVKAGLIKVTPELNAYYQRRYSIRPAGDVDVIERQQIIQAMMSAWPVIANTPAAVPFLMDMLSKMFPDNASKYNQILKDAQEQQKSEQAVKQQQLMQGAMALGQGIIQLAEHPEYFSDIGKIHSLPAVKQMAERVEQTMTATMGDKQ